MRNIVTLRGMVKLTNKIFFNCSTFNALDCAIQNLDGRTCCANRNGKFSFSHYSIPTKRLELPQRRLRALPHLVGEVRLGRIPSEEAMVPEIIDTADDKISVSKKVGKE